MKLYTSGTPTDNHFQVIENQMCSHRLFSMHGNYQREVMKWLDRIRSGVRTFDDYCNGRRDFLRRLDHTDTIMRRTLLEQGVQVDWVPSADAFRQASERHAAVYPRHIMLDSGAFTAWNKGHVIALDEVKAAYSSFLSKAGDLFDEVWLINLDRIPGSKGMAATDDEKALAIEESDRNFAALKAEFGDRVLPVFHQGEEKARLLEVIDQAAGYLCLSPMNDLPERERWLWARRTAQALFDLRCNVQTHGLATTGNEMIRESFLFSGDSAAWKRHGGFGVVDLMEDEPTIDRHVILDESGGWEEHEIRESNRARYRAYHIGRERNDFDRK